MDPIGLFIKEERTKQKMSQEALSEGICSNTYLSKIEAGYTEANEEIIQLLIEALGYHYNTEDGEYFTSIRDTIWERCFSFNLEKEDYNDTLKDVLKAMRFSPYSLDVYLLENLVSILEEETVLENFFDFDTKHCNERQAYEYASIVSLHNYGRQAEKRYPINIEDTIGFISYYKTSELFLEGKYRQAIQVAKKTYETFAYNGNVMGMINISFQESSSYSNLNDQIPFIEISERIRRLNTYVKRDDIEYFIDYNLGSSYLVQNKLELSEHHLLRCMDNPYQSDSNLSFEKLILVYLLKEDYHSARSYLSKVKKEDLNSYTFLQLMIERKNDYKDPEVISELEKCYVEEYRMHHGRRMLFGALLYNSYRSTYQYPKAIKILEDLNFNEIPLFFKK